MAYQVPIEARTQADPEAEAIEARDTLAAIAGAVVSSQEDYVVIGEVLSEANHKFKFLEEERKITVAPANEEVKRINDWFRPALDALKSIRAQAESMMSAWIIHQRKEEKRLMDEAAAAAAVVLAASATGGASPATRTIAAATSALVSQAAAAAPPKVANVSHKPVWRWVVKDQASLPRAFLMADEKKIAAHVSKYGNTNVPSGVEVTEDVSFTVRS